MKEKLTYTHLPDDPCIDEETMFRYIDGKLSPPEMHVVEKHLIDCAFCSDALEGLQKTEDRKRLGAYLTENNGMPGEIIQPEAKIIPLNNRKLFYYSAAACAALIIGFFTMRSFIISSDKSASRTADNTNPRVAPTEVIPRLSNADSSFKSDSSLVNGLTASKDRREDVRTVTATDRAGASLSNAGPGVQQSTEVQDKEMVAGEDDVPGFFNTHSDYFSQNADSVVAQHNLKNLNELTQAEAQSPKTDLDLAKDEVSQVVVQPDKKAKDKEASTADSRRGNNILGNLGSNAPQAASGAGNVASNQNIEAPKAPASSSADDANSEGNDNQHAQVIITDTTRKYYPNKESDKDIQLSYDKGVELLNAGKAEQSLVFFDDVLQYPKDKNFEDAQWKKAEALLKLGKKDEAKTLLTQIANGNGRYHTQAADKLKTL